MSDVTLYLADCETVMPLLNKTNSVIVTDPPFNIGYHYATYKDKKPENKFYSWLGKIFSGFPSVIIMYPEMLYKLAFTMNIVPHRVVSWVYPSNTRRQHRDIAFFNISPDFSKVRQPYRNPNDKRIKKLIEGGGER